MTAAPEQITFRQQVLLSALAASAVSIPLLVNINSISLIYLVFACVIQQPWAELKAKLAKPSLWMVPAAYFLWLCCSWLWDSSGGFAIRDVERYAMLFFIPVSLAVIPRIPEHFMRIVAALFIAVITVICICCLIRSWNEYQITGDYRVFFYHYLSQQMELNAIFLSNFCLASTIWLLYSCFGQDRRHRWFTYVLVLLLCLFLSGMILLLSSKLIISLFLVSLVIFMLYVGFSRRYFIGTSIGLLVLIAMGWLAANNLGYMRWRFTATSAKKYSGEQDNNNGLSIRILMWQTAWHLVREKPLLGYGVNGARKTVVDKYKKENFELGYLQGYHSHNQYLQSALIGGVPALILLLAMLAKMVAEGFRQKNILLLLLMFHFIIQSVVESTFEVQQELVFYMFFGFLLYYHPPDTGKSDKLAAANS